MRYVIIIASGVSCRDIRISACASSHERTRPSPPSRHSGEWLESRGAGRSFPRRPNHVMIATSSPNTLGSQWAEALAGADPAAVELADRLLNKLESRADAVFETAELGCGAWRVGVCLEDRIGSLSLVSGALAAHGLNIVNADTFTYVEPNSPPKRTAPPLRLRPSRLGRRVRRRRRHALDPSPAARAVMLFDVRALRASAALGRARGRAAKFGAAGGGRRHRQRAAAAHRTVRG